MLQLHKIITISHVVACPFVSVVSWSRLVGRSAQTYEKWSFYSIVSRLAPFYRVFAQVKEWLILELHEMIRARHVVAYPIVYILFYDREWLGGEFQFMKNNHFLIFFCRLGLFALSF